MVSTDPPVFTGGFFMTGMEGLIGLVGLEGIRFKGSSKAGGIDLLELKMGRKEEDGAGKKDSGLF